ncbi:MAG: phosphoribosylformylglycinamidine synthase, partial [Chloroflexota bacterium]
TANPLVYCGSVGIGPHQAHVRRAQPGDHILVIGGRRGRDGLRGATFSSLTMDAQTGQVAGASVQIGDPITEKGVIEVSIRARDARLYHAITDCGAGGLSSAVGEMSEAIGARVDLSAVPLKYAGLSPWEIWLSEAQERMVLAAPVSNIAAIQALCDTYDVEMSDIGEFSGDGRLQVLYHDIPVVDLEEEFLHHGIPQMTLEMGAPRSQSVDVGSEIKDVKFAAVHGEQQCQANNHLLLALLAHPNIASKEEIIRRYDHEVRGATIVRPFAGVAQVGPSDAAVLKPLETPGWRGFVLANGINPFLGEADPYWMAFSVVDEAVRNAVAVGADPKRLALLDNFCWGDPRRPETMSSLVAAAQGCRDASLYYQAPFISGKDSLNNEYLGSDGQRHAIPGTLLISSIAIHPDVRCAVTMDLKTPGNRLYLAGDFQPSLAGSHAVLVAGAGAFDDSPALHRAPGQPQHANHVYQALHAAIHSGLVCSAHDLSEGGLAVAGAEMALAGRLGLRLDTNALGANARLALFGETNGCLLVEVRPEDCKAFEEHFERPFGDSACEICRPVGEVVAEEVIQVIYNREIVLELDVDSLIKAFTMPGPASK